MTHLLTLSIGVGLSVSLLFSELFGLAAGGMVVPGYIALYLDQPVNLAITLATGIAAFFLVHTLSMFTIVYGKRRTTLMILVGFLLGVGLEHLPVRLLEFLSGFEPHHSADIRVIGYIIPGLIGIWIDRQGLLETLSVLLTASVVVRLVLIVLGVEMVA